MYSYLYLSLIILGLFSIFENIKGGRNLSLMKLNFILVLVSITFASTIDFVNEMGYKFDLFGALVRVITTILIVNVFQIVANNKLPRIIIIIELFVFVFYFISILYGYRFTTVKEGIYSFNFINISVINIFIFNPSIIIFMAFNLFKILKITDQTNLYQQKIKKWSVLLFIFFILVLVAIVASLLLYVNQITFKMFDSRLIYISNRFILILFIFLRPKFIDEIGVSYLKSSPLAKGQISLQNFEFLFYFNQYFLKSDANLEDFSIMLNHTKSEVTEYIKKQTSDSFNELVTKNRINYFKELLKTKQHESFTIEALSEMSGFNNRQSMYNAFKKYEECSPSEYINSL